jgi:hypothetical protein
LMVKVLRQHLLSTFIINSSQHGRAGS